MNWAWSLPLRPTTKLVLMSLSDVADDLGECFPSIKYIAERCCISTRHTRREIQKLAELRLLEVKKRLRKDGSHASNLYQLAIPKIGDDNLSPPSNPAPKASPRHERVTPPPPGNDVETLPLTTKEPSIKPTTTTAENTDLNWPTDLHSTDRFSIEKIVVGITAEIAQQLLDELAGQLANIKRPVAYFHALLQKHRQGLFIPSSSTQVKTSREAKHKNALDLENATSQNIQRLRDYGVQIEDDS